jgi:hypothetical protein
MSRGDQKYKDDDSGGCHGHFIVWYFEEAKAKAPSKKARFVIKGGKPSWSAVSAHQRSIMADAAVAGVASGLGAD